MPGPNPEVAEFRSIVHDAIHELNNQHPMGWPDKTRVATLGRLTFASYDSSHGTAMGPSFRGVEGHVWGIISRKQPVGKYVADIALLSVEGREDTLERRFAIPSPFSGLIETNRAIEQPEEVSSALKWARSPHIYGSVMRRLAELTPEEEATIGEAYERHSAAGQELRDELHALEMERRALGDGPY